MKVKTQSGMEVTMLEAYLETSPLLIADLFSAGASGGANRRSPTGGAAKRILLKL